MEACSAISVQASMISNSAVGPRLPSSWASSPAPCLAPRHGKPFPRLCSPSLSSSFPTVCTAVRASDRQSISVSEEGIESLESGECYPTSVFGSLTAERKTFVALLLSLGLALGSAEAAMALGPEGPVVEEFWDNMRRYAFYFLTVFTGGLYSLLEPVFALLRNPITAILTIAILSGSFYLLFLLLNTMLGITSFEYSYS